MPFITASTTINKVQNTVAGNTPPTSPTIGQMWNDTSATPPILKVWNGSEWVPVNMSIKQLDPVSFDEINRIINDTINDVNQSRDDINNALNQAQQAIEKAEFNNEKITAIEKTQSDDGKKIVELQTNYNGVQQSIKDLDSKTETVRIELAGQISEVVKKQDATNQRVTTAEQNISSLTTSDGKQNQRLDTAEKSLQVISKKTDDNMEVINQTKKTADSNSQKIISTDGRVSNVEQTLTKQTQTIADNTGKINKAIQDIDSAERIISSVDGRVSKVEQNLSGFSSTVSNVQNQLNNKANQSDLDKTNQALSGKADTSFVTDKVNGISVGGTNLLPNTSPMPTMVSFPATKDSVLSNDWQRFNENISGKEVLPKNIPGYSLKLDKGTKIVESILVKTDGVLTGAKFTFYDNAHHYVDANIKEISNNGTDRVYQVWCQYTCVGTTFRAIDLGYIYYNHKSYIAFSKPKIEIGTIPTEWSPAPEDKANQVELVDQLKNRSNLWPDSTFENKKLSDYSTISDANNLVHIVINGAKNTTADMPKEYGVEYKKQNSSDKALRFEGRTDGNTDCFLKDDYMFDVSDGDVFNVSYDFYKQASSTATVGFKCIKYDGSVVDWLGVFGSNNSGGQWWHKDGQIIIPSGKGIVKVLPYAALGKTTNASDYLYIDNIVIKLQDSKQTSIDTQVKSQQSQINQTAGKVDIIASENGNANAYLNINSNGDINIGANHRLVLSANTYVTDGFTFSANNIKAGKINGKNMTIDLDAGKVESNTPLSSMTFGDGKIKIEDPSSHFAGYIKGSPNAISIGDEVGDYGFLLHGKDGRVSLFNVTSSVDVSDGIVNIEADYTSGIKVERSNITVQCGDYSLNINNNGIKVVMNTPQGKSSFNLKQACFNNSIYPAILSDGDSGIAFGGNVPYVKSMGKWYSLNQIITKTGVKPVD